MTYHSEPITRRYIGYSRYWQIKNRNKVQTPDNDRNAEKFSERWESASLESASFEQKSDYFSIGASFLGGMTGLMLLLSFLLLQLFTGFAWGAAMGYLFLPFTIYCSVWASFAWRSNQSKMIKDYSSPFTRKSLIKAIIVGIAGSILLVLFFILILDPTAEHWI
jgi:polyferredoxin